MKMENQNAKRGSKILKILGILLAIGAICYICVKVYRKVLSNADDESITKYQISCDLDSKISIQAFSSIAEDIVFLQNVLILE